MNIVNFLLRLYSLCVANGPWPNLNLIVANDARTVGASPVRPGQMDYG